MCVKLKYKKRECVRVQSSLFFLVIKSYIKILTMYSYYNVMFNNNFSFCGVVVQL